MTESVPQVHLQKRGGAEKKDASVAAGKMIRSRRRKERSVGGCRCRCNNGHRVILLGRVFLCLSSN